MSRYVNIHVTMKDGTRYRVPFDVPNSKAMAVFRKSKTGGVETGLDLAGPKAAAVIDEALPKLKSLIGATSSRRK